MTLDQYVSEIGARLENCSDDRSLAFRVLAEADQKLRSSSISREGQSYFWRELRLRVDTYEQMLLEKQAAAALAAVIASIQAAIDSYHARVASGK